jgi:hypothetical protein
MVAAFFAFLGAALGEAVFFLATGGIFNLY